MKIIKPEIGRFKNWQTPNIEHGKPTEYGWIIHHPENSIIEANCFVTKDVPKNSFYAGVPAKLIKELFDE